MADGLYSNGKQYKLNATYIIDATELGDIAKQAGLKYHAGMDASSETGEVRLRQLPTTSYRI